MIHEFRFSNFHSFRDEAIVSFRVGKRAPGDGRTVLSPTGESLVTAMAVIGANASGKTNLLKPLSFLEWFVPHSFHGPADGGLLIQSHAGFKKQEPSTFFIEFEVGERVFRYVLTATSERVVHEALHEKTSRSFSYRFRRDWDNESGGYTIVQKGFGLNQSEALKVRPNASLISTTLQYEVPGAGTVAGTVAAFFKSISTNVGPSGFRHGGDFDVAKAADAYRENDAMNEAMTRFMRLSGFGVSGFAYKKSKIKKRSVKLIVRDGQKESIVGETRDDDHVEAFCIHPGHDRDFQIRLESESSGTKGAFVLLSRILPALRGGGVVVVDELDAHMHPHMMVPLLDMFFNEDANPGKAQIFFTCHTPQVLDLLHKSQVMLVEKPNECCSAAWRLDSMEGVRNDANHYAKYMAGAYGAVPMM